MSNLALGNPVVAYSYKYDAKGSAFNKLFYNILSPGIYNGGGLSFSGNEIIVSAYDALFPYPPSNQAIAVHTNSAINLSASAGSGGYGLGNITTSLPYIAMYFIWTDSEGVYPDYGFFDSSITTNASYLVLGKATFTGSSVSGFDYSSATYPPRYNTTTKGLNVRGLTDSTSSSTGSVIVNGGMGIAKSAYIGNNLSVSGIGSIGSSLDVVGSITGSSTLQGTQLKSTVASGTSPLTVNSDTIVTNLNADMLDGKHVGTSGNTIPILSASNTWSGIQTYSAIPAFNGGTSGSSAPFTVDSTFKVTNLNADLLDGYNTSTSASANTIPVYNASAQLVGNITGIAPLAHGKIAVPFQGDFSDDTIYAAFITKYGSGAWIVGVDGGGLSRFFGYASHTLNALFITLYWHATETGGRGAENIYFSGTTTRTYTMSI